MMGSSNNISPWDTPKGERLPRLPLFFVLPDLIHEQLLGPTQRAFLPPLYAV
jgi:hypothetical protein